MYLKDLIIIFKTKASLGVITDTTLPNTIRRTKITGGKCPLDCCKEKEVPMQCNKFCKFRKQNSISRSLAGFAMGRCRKSFPDIITCLEEGEYLHLKNMFIRNIIIYTRCACEYKIYFPTGKGILCTNYATFQRTKSIAVSDREPPFIALNSTKSDVTKKTGNILKMKPKIRKII